MADTTTAATIPVDAYPAGGELHHGRRVWALGEDGDMGVMVEGHGLRALAAVNAHQRGLCGVAWRQDDFPRPRLHVEEMRVVFHEECGCTPEQHDTDHRDEFGFHDIERCDCAHPGLPPCEEERFAWVFEKVEEGTPGALAVTEVSW